MNSTALLWPAIFFLFTNALSVAAFVMPGHSTATARSGSVQPSYKHGLQLYCTRCGFRRPRTTRDRRWSAAWKIEDDAVPSPIRKNNSAPLVRVRGARTIKGLPSEWDDEMYCIERCWKTQSKRRHQWKPAAALAGGAALCSPTFFLRS